MSAAAPTGAVTTLVDPPPQLAPADLRFADRREAGERLARLLGRFAQERPIVVGMPRGGVPVAAEVARALHAPLDVAVVRKIGAPQNPEFAIGALAEGGVHVLSAEAVRALGLSAGDVRRLAAPVERELAERTRLYRGGRPQLDVHGRTVIVVDDGLATGRSARAAIESVRARGAARVILAVPVAAPASLAELRNLVEDVVCVAAPEDMWAVGLWYDDFSATSEEEVVSLLAASSAPATTGAPGVGPPATTEAAALEVAIELDGGPALEGELTAPAGATGIVVFAHGSGSSRRSPRNRAVAARLSDAGHATLLFDLLTGAEEADRANVFDVPLLASRLVGASTWLARREQTRGLALSYFGASTGAAAALTAAAQLGEQVSAVISRGGRPDLAVGLEAVRAPTLLIVGGADREVLTLNRLAEARLRCPARLAIVPGATHLFEEPGAIEEVGRLALEWLRLHLPAVPAR